MNQSGSYSVNKRSDGDNQELLSEFPTNNGVVAAKSIKHNGEFHTEKTYILEPSSQPVKLTPAWEDDTNLSDDELNFKSFTMDRSKLEINPPRDRFKIVYLILILHGIGALTPWNMFITAQKYFVDYKLSVNYTGEVSPYTPNFLNYLTIASQVPNLLFNWLNVFMNIRGNLTTRVVWSIFIEVVVFVMTVVLAMCDTSSYSEAFFWITIVSVVVLNMAGGVYQNTVFGIGAKLPPDYTGAIILGSNISGTFTAIINLLAQIFSPNVRTAAIYYFITALFVLLACFDTYFALPLIRFYRYQEYISQKYQRIQERGLFRRVPFFTVFVKALPQLFNVFFTFFVTLALFPAVHSAIERSDNDFIISSEYYVSIMCFVTFNVTAMIGSLLTNWIKWPSPKYLVILVVLRALFIPFYLFCNYTPATGRVLPVYITNDWIYLTGAILMGLSSGYCSSLAMIYVPRTVGSEHAETAGMYGGATLITGILTGILFSMVFPWLVKLNFSFLIVS